MPPESTLSKAELFARLAEGHAAGVTVVTPNARLAQALVLDFDAVQAARGKASWEAADILPLGAFVERLWEEALYSEAGEKLPLLLSPPQEQQLWEQTLEKSGLLAVPQAAAQCRDAWRLQHAWRTGNAPGNDDANAFLAWSREYQRRTQGRVDAARLPDLVSRHLESVKAPRLLVAYAFDIVPPQTQEFLSRFELATCQPDAMESRATKARFASAKEELETAARWTRARLEAGGRRIAVVVPDLHQRRKEVVRVFSRVMQPGYNLPGRAQAPMPFNVSLGSPLHEQAIVALALSVLRFSIQEIGFDEASRLIRSPFIAGAESERSRRAALDARLRRSLGATVALPKLIGMLDKSVLRERLEKVFALRDEGLFRDKTPSDWARHFSAVLDAAGFPGERTLDSDEFQARAKLHEVLGEFAKLEVVKENFSGKEAVLALQRLCAETLFQPESQGAPIQVLGVLESTGLAFDHLWVSGLTDDAWPLRARPNPFLPLPAQRKAGIPEATAESSLALDRRITAQWRTAAKEVVFSFHAKDKDRDLAPSPLIADIPEGSVDVPAFPRLRDLIFTSKSIAVLEDRAGPAFTERQVRGGTKVLADQAACPFRAFARHRLAAEELEEPAEGLDASARGKLLHELMNRLWTSLKDSSALDQDLSEAIEEAADAAVKELALEGRFADLERARLARLAREWLEVERQRPPFSVHSLEEKRTLTFAGLEFSARIDRMDKLGGKGNEGGYALIDYKTSRNPSPKHWEPPRPDDPQLALYAVSAPEEVAAVAFAKVRPGEMRFMGFSREPNALPKVKKYDGWSRLLVEWKQEAESLGASFAAGEARVDPKRDLLSCRYCGLETLCRVYEKINVLAENEEGEE